MCVLYFQQIEKLPDYFQNHNGRMIFFKIHFKLGDNRDQFEKKFEVIFFFVPINFSRDFIHKIGAIFEFLVKSGFVSNLFLKRFLCEKEDHIGLVMILSPRYQKHTSALGLFNFEIFVCII